MQILTIASWQLYSASRQQKTNGVQLRWLKDDGACTAERTLPQCQSNTTVGCPSSQFCTTQKSPSAVINGVQSWENATLQKHPPQACAVFANILQMKNSIVSLMPSHAFFVSTNEESIENTALQIACSCNERVLKQIPVEVQNILAVVLNILTVQSSDDVSANFLLWENKRLSKGDHGDDHAMLAHMLQCLCTKVWRYHLQPL